VEKNSSITHSICIFIYQKMILLYLESLTHSKNSTMTTAPVLTFKPILTPPNEFFYRDLILELIKHLCIEDIASLRLICKYLHSIITRDLLCSIIKSRTTVKVYKIKSKLKYISDRIITITSCDNLHHLTQISVDRADKTEHDCWYKSTNDCGEFKIRNYCRFGIEEKNGKNYIAQLIIHDGRKPYVENIYLGLLHRKKGPAFYEWTLDEYAFGINGLFHRNPKEGPAYFYGVKSEDKWCVNGRQINPPTGDELRDEKYTPYTEK